MSRRWPRKKQRADHADDWLMTYADMITLLLCFFAVFLSLSMPRKDIPPKVETPPPVAQAAKPADILEGNLPFHGLPRAYPATEEEDDIVPSSPPVPPAPPIAQAAEVPVPPASIPSAPASPPEILDPVQAQGGAPGEPKGDRITTIQLSSAPLFAVGSATLSEPGKSILQAVAANLTSDPYQDYQITVEGHTDDSPIDTPQFPSNWELSTARAAAVVHFFLQEGVPARRLRAAGYADTFPLAPNRDSGGNPIPANQARNRRVVIKLEKIEKAE